MKINVELVTPEELVFSSSADMVVVPGGDGDFGVLEGHSPMISTIRPGVVSLYDGEKKKDIFISGGFAEVTGERCTILATKSVDVSGLGEEKIKQMIEEAEKEASA